VDHEIEAPTELLANRLVGQPHSRHQRERLDPTQRILGRVGVDGRERSLVTGVQGHEEIERFAAAHLADHDPVRPHAKGASQEVANSHQPAALDVRGAALEADDVGLSQAQLGGVLDRDHPLRLFDEGGECVEERRLARAGPAADQDAASR
jgi:hypothetical protein